MMFGQKDIVVKEAEGRMDWSKHYDFSSKFSQIKVQPTESTQYLEKLLKRGNSMLSPTSVGLHSKQ